MSLKVYTILHVISVIYLFTVFGAILALAKNYELPNFPNKKVFMSIHGLALLALAVTGYGMYRYTGYPELPAWMYGKIIIWLILGGLPILILKKKSLNTPMWVVTLLFGMLATYIGIHH